MSKMIDFTPGPANKRQFRTALGQFATGVTVVTTHSASGPLGITANSFSSISLDPPLVLWAPARSASRFQPFVEAEHFAIHVMSETQGDICRAFVHEGNAFDMLDWRPGIDGTPLIDNCLARFVCARHAVHDGGDHAIVVGRVLSAAVGDGTPLIFTSGRFGALKG
ncbi:flavin reductase family protein [Oceaniglobus indicus]|uniref:flavin reductase family protein n=1 Tax=Oceaniglobus indicus TaxID=2047749 RepID=UPI000C1A0409|nr:flavin reductase family protein [Oceaniglobus indicus]